MEKGHRKFSTVPPAQPPRGKGRQIPASDSFAEHLCTHMQHVISHATAHNAQPSHAAPQPSAEQAAATAASSAAPQSAPPAVQPLAKPIVDFICTVMASACNKQQAATARRALKLAQSLVEALQQQRCTVPAGLSLQLFRLTFADDKAK